MIDSSQSEQQFSDTCETGLSSFCTVPLEDSRVHVCLRHTVAAHTSPTHHPPRTNIDVLRLQSALTHLFQTEASCISASSPWPPCTQSTEGEERRGGREISRSLWIFIDRSCEERLHIQSANIIFRTMSNSNFYKIRACHLFTNKVFHADRKRRIRLPGCIQGAFPGPLKVKCTHLLGN